MKVIHTQTVEHHNQKRVMLIFNFDYDLIEQIKELQGRKWIKNKNCWHIPFQEDYLAFLNDRFNNEESVY